MLSLLWKKTRMKYRRRSKVQRTLGDENRVQRHLFAARQAIGLLSHHLVSTFLLLIFACVLLALPLCLLNMLQNVHAISGNLHKNAVINLYLSPGVSAGDADRLVGELKLRPDVYFERYIPPDVGLEEFESQSGLSELTKYLKDNPIPGVVVLKPSHAKNSLSAINQLVGSLRQLPGVGDVVVNVQWLSRAYALVHSLNNTIIVFTLIVYILVLVITTTLFHMLLPVFPIERPFLTIFYLGLMLGVVNGTLSDYVVNYALISLKELLAQLTFIDASLQNLHLTIGSLIYNLLFAILTMIVSGLIVHKYRIRVG